MTKDKDYDRPVTVRLPQEVFKWISDLRFLGRSKEGDIPSISVVIREVLIAEMERRKKKK